jgi:PAS domain S-box-containing protein
MTDSEWLARREAEPQASLLRALVDKLPAMLAYWDANLRCRFANRAYQKWFGVNPEAMIGRDMAEFLGPLFALNLPYIQGALRGEEQEFEREIPDPAGGPARYSQAHYIPDIVDGQVRGFCVLVADITRRKRAEDSLREAHGRLQAAERLAAMATLAGGIAHELNNPLASVLANVELALESVDVATAEADTLRKALVEARDGAKRVGDIVRTMKLLARGDTTRRELVDVNETVEQSLRLTSNAIRYRARLVRDLADVGHVDGNPFLLAQVFASLLVNAAQALPVESAASNEIRVSSRRTGDDVVVEVADNGAGIPDDLQAHIFEPFFTTKDVGGGMGLGLAIAVGIVTSLGGKISVTSTVGRGSLFRVILPAAARSARSPAPAAPSDGGGRPLARAAIAARPRLLVIDDEPTLTRVVERALAKQLEVVAVNGGREAIALLTEQSSQFDLILCDLMMPEATGETVYTEVCQRRPELAGRFIFMTGGAFTPDGRRFLDAMGAPLLEKPFELGRLRELVMNRLGRWPGPNRREE